MHYYKLTNICACLSLFWSLMCAAWLHLSMFHLLSALYTEINKETSAEEENVSISWSTGMHFIFLHAQPQLCPKICPLLTVNHSTFKQWVKQEHKSPLLYNNILPNIFYIFITVNFSKHTFEFWTFSHLEHLQQPVGNCCHGDNKPLTPPHCFPSLRSHCWGVGVDTLHYPLNRRLCEHAAWCISCLGLCTRLRSSNGAGFMRCMW